MRTNVADAFATFASPPALVGSKKLGNIPTNNYETSIFCIRRTSEDVRLEKDILILCEKPIYSKPKRMWPFADLARTHGPDTSVVDSHMDVTRGIHFEKAFFFSRRLHARRHSSKTVVPLNANLRTAFESLDMELVIFTVVV